MEEKNKKLLISFKLLTDNKKAEKSDVEPDKDGDYPEKARD